MLIRDLEEIKRAVSSHAWLSKRINFRVTLVSLWENESWRRNHIDIINMNVSIDKAFELLHSELIKLKLWCMLKHSQYKNDTIQFKNF